MDQIYRLGFAPAAAIAMASILLASAVRADDPVPVIATWELHKARTDARAARRDPKGFWIGEIVERIEDRKPMTKLALKQPATVAVTFVVGRDGKLVSSSVSKTSGDPAIDRQALAALGSAAPFPPMPASLPDDSVAFTVPLRFR